jgi:hypothetical protein
MPDTAFPGGFLVPKKRARAAASTQQYGPSGYVSLDVQCVVTYDSLTSSRATGRRVSGRVLDGGSSDWPRKLTAVSPSR